MNRSPRQFLDTEKLSPRSAMPIVFSNKLFSALEFYLDDKPSGVFFRFPGKDVTITNFESLIEYLNAGDRRENARNLLQRIRSDNTSEKLREALTQLSTGTFAEAVQRKEPKYRCC